MAYHSIQQAVKKIDQLQAEVDALKAENADLKKQVKANKKPKQSKPGHAA